MIRATLAVCVLLASIFVLSQNLFDSSDETVRPEPRLIDVPTSETPLTADKLGQTLAFSPGQIELVGHVEVDHVELVNGLASPPIEMIAQRWGGRSSFRSRMRRSSTPRVNSTQPWQMQSPATLPTPARPAPSIPGATKAPENLDDLPMAELGKPIPAPASVVPQAKSKPTPTRTPKPLPKTVATPKVQPQPRPAVAEPKILSRPVDEAFDSLGIVDPADPTIQRQLQPKPAVSRKPVQTVQPAPPIRVKPAPAPAPVAAAPAPTKPRYFDVDWYQPSENVTRVMTARQKRIAQALDHYYQRPLNSQDHSPWSLMHTMVAWGSDSYIRAGGPRGRSVGTVHWLANNGLSDGVRLLEVKNSKLVARTGPGLQGHDGQLLAMLAQTRVRSSYPISVDGRKFTVKDLVTLEKKTCRSDMELTFKLIGLSHYLAPEETWRSETGTRWSIPKLINAEIAAPINGVTCGGTHRLMGLKYAVRMRRRAGLPVSGEWARAEKYTNDYVSLALRQQNEDGSFSSNFFRGRGSWGDNDRKLKTTGHILEYVVFTVPHDKLQDQRVTNAVDYLTSLLMENRYYDWPKGPIGHAIRALSLYNERVFNQPPGKRRAAKMAQKRKDTSTK